MLSESEFVGLMDNEKELVIEESEENEDDDLDFAMF